MSRRSKGPLPLSEQLAELFTPKPADFGEEEAEIAPETTARVCDYEYGEKESLDAVKGSLRRDPMEDDPRYAGKAVSRRSLEAQEISSDSENDDGDAEEGDGVEGGDRGSVGSDGDVGSDGGIGEGDSDLDGSEVGSGGEGEGGEHDADSTEECSEPQVSKSSKQGEGTGEEEEEEVMGNLFSLSLKSANEDLEKGKAAKLQISMWDTMLEGRIRMQKVLLLGNRLPQLQGMADFRAIGGERLAQALGQSQKVLAQTLDSLLDLQSSLLAKVPEIAVTGGGGRHAPPQSSTSADVEEIPSDSEDGDHPDVDQEGGGSGSATATGTQRKRKRTREWVLPGGQRQYEEYIAQVYGSLRSYRKDVIAKWNSKTQLISGKLTNKAFVSVDQSVLTQIQNVLNDKARLIKRTQLKRFTSSVLGKRQRMEEKGEEEGDQTVPREEGPLGDPIDCPRGERDAHLRNCDDEIFDDEDFYHRLLKDLIERKMNFTETSDPITMGRQWLELQKLRTKAKKKVDTKASKGRKIRYHVHPKLVNFMAPIQRGSMSDASRNDLFCSLFGGSDRTVR